LSGITSLSEEIVNNPSPLRLTSEFSDVVVIIDPHSGAPLALETGGRDFMCPAVLSVTTGGNEVRGAMGGLVYEGSILTAIAPAEPASHFSSLGEGHRIHRVTTSAHSPFALEWTYRFQSSFPRVSVSVDVVATKEATVRNVQLDLQLEPSTASQWRLQAPGGKYRANLDIRDISQRLFVSPVGGVNGSTGLLAFENVDNPLTWVFWPIQTHTIGDLWFEADGPGFHLHCLADVAGVLAPGARLSVNALHLDLVPATFTEVLDEVPDALARNSIAAHGDAPEWGAAANLYEVQIGYSVFHQGFTYSPYPTVRELINDLDRIHALGFTALQIMPRHPFPSYNVADYDDITKSYGDENDLKELIALCHERGMKVILDILLHGVIDGEIVATAVESIKSGPFGNRMDETIDDITVLEEDEFEPYSIAWGRHVLDFSPHWSGGSPHVHPLRLEHPEWFCEDSAGNPIGIYTNAFDTANPGWQEYFVGVCLDLLSRLNADGFRFDAPSYNYFMNWSERTRSSAHVSMLGSVPLFAMLRKAIREARPDALLYTEPSGALFRRDMDLTYNYDEQWLVRAITAKENRRDHWIRNARELVEWLAHRDRSLPFNSMTAHHIDSHDTFWWPSPGRKWRRNQYGESRTAALMAIFALRGEPYMTFVGGEEGIEAEVAAVNSARLKYPVLATGQVIHDPLDVSDDHVYAILLRGLDQEAIIAVNTVDTPINVTIQALDGNPFTELMLDVPAWRSQGEAITSGRSVAAELNGAGVRIFLRER
jgi:glycosidase